MREDYFDSYSAKKGVGVLGVISIFLIAALLGAGGMLAYFKLSDKSATGVPNVTQTPGVINTPANTPNASSTPSVSNDYPDDEQTQNAFTKIYDTYSSAVVVVTTYINYNNRLTAYSGGSGFIISDDGYILTNNHVVQDVEKVEVTLQSGNKYDASIVGTDERSEVALIKIQPTETLTKAVLGDSDNLKVGQYAIAIGNPLGYNYSLSFGIVSGLERTVNSNNYRFKMIQISTLINSGNSGGPLFDINGKVIGITTMKSSSSGYSTTVEGIGFAIPINTAKQIAQQLKSSGKVTRAAINATVRNIVDRQGNAAGVEIVELAAGGAAQKAGLKEGDIIVKFNDTDIKTVNDLMEILDGAEIGESAKLTVIRDNSQSTVNITLGKS